MKERFTWYDLKKFCNDLPAGVLGQEVIAWGEEKGAVLKGIEVLEDDFFNPSGEGLEPVSHYRKHPEDWEEVKDEPILARKGDPRLLID